MVDDDLTNVDVDRNQFEDKQMESNKDLSLPIIEIDVDELSSSHVCFSEHD